MKETKFKSLAQRIANGWLETIPNYIPVPGLPLQEVSQRQFHEFLKHVAESVKNHPDWLELPEFPDDGYNHGELMNRRPELNEAMRKIRRKLDDFIGLLLRIGLVGTLGKDGKSLHIEKSGIPLVEKTRIRLSRIGLALSGDKQETVIMCPDYPELFPAWVWLAADATRTAPITGKANVPPLRFSHGLFSESHPYGRDVLLLLSGNQPALIGLITWLEEQGYALHNNRDNRLTADWVKSYGASSEPLKDSWGERTHGGLAIDYEWVRKRPLLYGLRIPEFKQLLQKFDAMSPALKSFLVRQTKKCDHCGYCTQTDKTGTRKPAFFTVEHQGRHALCPLFPGFSFTWQDFNDPLGEDIKEFLLFADEALSTK